MGQVNKGVKAMKAFLKGFTVLVAIVGLFAACCLDSENTLFFLALMVGCGAWVIGYLYVREAL